MASRRESWTVLVILGVSGAGKSTLARHLAWEFGSSWMQSEDLRIAVHAAEVASYRGTPHPLHVDGMTPGDSRLEMPQDVSDQLIAVAEVMQAPVREVIANHVGHDEPMIIEGDSIHPDLVTEASIRRFVEQGVVVACCLRPTSPEQQHVSLSRRNRNGGLSEEEVTVLTASQWRYSEWLVARSAMNGIPIVDTVPRENLPARVLDLIRRGGRV